jgi:hypothetical protein
MVDSFLVPTVPKRKTKLSPPGVEQIRKQREETCKKVKGRKSKEGGDLSEQTRTSTFILLPFVCAWRSTARRGRSQGP